MATDSLIGQTFAGYRILRPLGAGGMGGTYLAEKDGREVVVKQAHDQGEKVEVLAREARFLASLRHPRLPAVIRFDSGLLIMERIAGETVEKVVETRARLPGWNESEDYLRQVAEWLRQLMDVLDYLHSLRPHPLLHRDIKASNVMIRPDGQLSLIDFGIARQFKEEKFLGGKKDTYLFYSAGWSAPEFETEKRTTPRSDLYMAGVLTHFLLSGEQPEEVLHNGQASNKPLTRLRPRPGALLWTGLVNLSERMRHADPSHRPAGAREVAAELQRLVGGSEEAVTTPCPACRRPVRVSCRFCTVCGKQVQAGAAAPVSGVKVSVDFPADHARTRDRILALSQAGRPARLDRFRVYEQLRELEQDPGFNELISLESLPQVERLPHQVEAVKTALQRMRGWCLLADEVGLGKTIETGLILKELMIRDLARKVLILAPKDLCSQWQQELFEKFGLFFLVFGKDVDYSLAWQCDRLIAPYKVAEDRFHRQEALAQRYDAVIMDEAHHLIMHEERRGFQERRRELLHSFARDLRKQYFLMLSATPLHDDLRDLHELLTLLKPGSVGDFASFKEKFIDPTDPLKPLNAGELRRKLEEVMIRRQRKQIAQLKFPQRDARRWPVDLDEGNRQQFLAFRIFVQGELWPLGEENRPFRNVLQLLVEAYHSSPEAFRGWCDELIRRFRNLLSPEVQEQLRRFQRAMVPEMFQAKVAKAADLVEATARAGHKVLVFTQYEDTARHLHGELARTGLEVVRYPGAEEGDDGTRALEALHALRTTAVALVCTENASEGLNLQVANTMVNFDLPWDPMKLEQRIGRIQRLQQKSEFVYIHNLFLRQTVEEDILGVLEEKLEMFRATIGHVEEILGNLAEDQSFDQVFLDLYLGKTEVVEEINIMVSQSPQASRGEQALNQLFEATPPPSPLPRSGEGEPDRRNRNSANHLGLLAPPLRFGEGAGGGVLSPAPATETRRTPAASAPTLSEPPAVRTNCPACGAAMLPEDQFCTGCGRVRAGPATSAAPTEAEGNLFCTECGQRLPHDAAFCTECGKAVVA